MIDYREIIRLKSDGRSNNQTAASCDSSRDTVAEVWQLAQTHHLKWPLNPDLSNPEIRQLLYPTRFEDFCILHWLTILLKNRQFDIQSVLARDAKEYLLQCFDISLNRVDVVIGYRADDSYFSSAHWLAEILKNTARALVRRWPFKPW